MTQWWDMRKMKGDGDRQEKEESYKIGKEGKK